MTYYKKYRARNIFHNTPPQREEEKVNSGGYEANPAITFWSLLFPGQATNNRAQRWFYIMVATILLIVDAILLDKNGTGSVTDYFILISLWVTLSAAGWHSIIGGLAFVLLCSALLTGIENLFILQIFGVFALAGEWISRSWFVPAGIVLLIFETTMLTKINDLSSYIASTLLLLGLTTGLGLAFRWQKNQARKLQAESAANRKTALEAAQKVRRELAVELHDTLAKDLARVMITAQNLAKNPPTDNLSSELIQLAELASTAARRLRPVILELDTPGIDPPVMDVINTCMTMLSSRKIILDSDVPAGIDDELTQRQRIVAGLIIRESATNILKYAPNNSVANLVIELLPANLLSITMTNLISETVNQDITGGFGLTNLAQRIESEGGTFQTGSTGSVWMIAATVPASNKPS